MSAFDVFSDSFWLQLAFLQRRMSLHRSCCGSTLPGCLVRGRSFWKVFVEEIPYLRAAALQGSLRSESTRVSWTRAQCRVQFLPSFRRQNFRVSFSPASVCWQDIRPSTTTPFNQHHRSVSIHSSSSPVRLLELQRTHHLHQFGQRSTIFSLDASISH